MIVLTQNTFCEKVVMISETKLDFVGLWINNLNEHLRFEEGESAISKLRKNQWLQNHIQGGNVWIFERTLASKKYSVCASEEVSD